MALIAIIHNCLIVIFGSHNILKPKRGVMNIYLFHLF